VKAYVILIERSSKLSYKAFHEELVAHPRFNLWWHYIKSSYLIVTDMNVGEISNHVDATLVKYGLPRRHLVLKADLRERQGRLPDDAWKWIRKNCNY
jgi:hypothetical protein